MSFTLDTVNLTPFDLSLTSGLILLLAGISWWQRLALSGQIILAAARAMVQLLLIGFILKLIFTHVHLLWIASLAGVMLLIATREVLARQHYPLVGWWGFIISGSAMFLSSFSLVILTLLVIIGDHPWYQPQYAIPLLGMILGNTMNGVALSMESLLRGAWQQQAMIQQRLVLGHTVKQAMEELYRDAVRVGLIPAINGMATAGVVSLPGMMTGQILAGSSPILAIKYQILVLFLITVSTGLAILFTTSLIRNHLFDHRARLCLDRLRINSG